MKTKFVKVSVEERLPNIQGMYMVIFKNNKVGKFNFWDEEAFKESWIEHVDFWLEEVPDREAEMLEMLNLSLDNFDSTLEYLKDSEYENELTEKIVPIMADIEMLIEDIKLSN